MFLGIEFMSSMPNKNACDTWEILGQLDIGEVWMELTQDSPNSHVCNIR